MLGRWKREVPVALSLILPGLGQLYNRQWLKGAALVVLTIWLSGRVSSEIDLVHPDRMSVAHLLAGLVALLVLLAYAIVDSRRVAARRLAS
jgi:hypothetical protein